MNPHQHLLNQLKEFGLNPKHWAIQRQGSHWKVNHLQNKGLNLVGQVISHGKRPCWLSLELSFGV